MAVRINRIVKILISSDLVLNSGWGLLTPVFAIFLLENIALGDGAYAARIAGFAALSYWLVKSGLQIPIGHYLDKNHGEKDDFLFMVIGIFLAGIISFGFIFASAAWHIYVLQVFLGMAMAMAIPSWSAIFTRHIDKGKEALEWSIESTVLGFGAGIGGALGGAMAALFGFQVIFIFVGSFSIISAAVLLSVHKEIMPSTKRLPHVPFKPLLPR